ncbi:C-type mannose receptor 2-like isoform X4 [Gadus chalcogrammus]|uniref:C-type mannose receptor 2-like isoform X4 n=1 Tax=Gadus chalcogrammus TaxID=1042646 RepID=UPI0024C4A9F9|nr:C-type mannose receptor 2-like isoform X4 [Gadus chalcogrammus]
MTTTDEWTASGKRASLTDHQTMFRVRVSAFRLIASPEYHYYNQILSWSDARSFCRSKHSDLATVTSMEEAQLLAQTTAGRGDAWIGLRNDGPAKWLWSDGSGEPLPLLWIAGQPDFSGGCVDTIASGWNDYNCTTTRRNLVCEDAQVPYYHPQPDLWEWTAARDHCRSLGMKLPKIKGMPDIAPILTPSLHVSVWIGLFWDRWAWSDESTSSLRYWTLGEPASLQGCAIVNVTDQGRWYEKQCETEMPFVCQGVGNLRRVLIKLKMESDGDLDRSAAGAQLLKQLEAQFRSQGISDFQLSWKGDIRRQDEINENPAAESHGTGPCDKRKWDEEDVSQCTN